MRRALGRTKEQGSRISAILTAIRRLWRGRLRTVATAIADLFPWTPLGTLLSIGAIFGLRRYAYEQLDLVWLVLGYAGLALLLLAPALVVPTALYVRFRRHSGQEGEEVGPLSLETGRSRPTGFSLPGLSMVPLVEVTWLWRAPEQAEVSISRSGSRLQERVTLHDRGHFPLVERGIAIADVFGLCRIWLSHVSHTQVKVLPALGALSRVPTLTSFAAGDDLSHPRGRPEGDRLEISRYVPGDPVRFVHWKLLARTRQLLVRRPETALSVARRVAAFMIAGEDDDATAALARLTLSSNFLGDDFVFGTAEQLHGVTNPAAALDLVLRSVALRERGATGADRFFANVSQGGPVAALLFAPPTPGPWLEQVRSLARNRPLRVLIGVDRLVWPPPRPAWRRFLFTPPSPAGHSAPDLERVVSSLRQARCEVAVYDRLNGRLLSDAHRGLSSKREAA